MRQSGVAGVVLEGSGAERGTSPGRREHRRRNGWCRSCSSPWAWTRRPTGRATGMSSRIRGSRRPGDPRVLAVRRDQEVPWDPSVGLARHEDEQHVATFAQERTRAERPGSGHIRPKRSFRAGRSWGEGIINNVVAPALVQSPAHSQDDCKVESGGYRLNQDRAYTVEGKSNPVHPGQLSSHSANDFAIVLRAQRKTSNPG